ncbi:(2Fe-2S)-binding protein [Haloechinothrix sp. LS1_15]|uniref:(2Fe-2S)-binding protein n=1 Tax=Haloechinothrix sp. LS1_15 TaxID=2652248 RepID=UPI002945C026|nr:(2Fe-2S)-binding protein [Haloechinothrix sp. LS1_15]MDV6012821.1 ferric iron reductase [Haloechinothrix sp. LS1_15]
MPFHAGALVGPEATAVPAARLADACWIRGRIELAGALYGDASARALATVSWYSASSVLVAPALESLVLTGTPLDPSLEAVTLYVRADGRFTGARSARVLPGGRDDLTGLGAAFGEALGAVVERFAAVSGARTTALWAIAADSIANRLLWAGQATGEVPGATGLAAPLAEAIGPAMPRPRYLDLDGQCVTRRVSCCLIDRATGGDKCSSCPNQHPRIREKRIREALGLVRGTDRPRIS